jgi:hypothetical protein
MDKKVNTSSEESYEISRKIISENTDIFLQELIEIETALIKDLGEDVYCGAYDLFCQLFVLNIRKGWSKEELFEDLENIHKSIKISDGETRH